jgi:hypothetical protein
VNNVGVFFLRAHFLRLLLSALGLLLHDVFELSDLLGRLLLRLVRCNVFENVFKHFHVLLALPLLLLLLKPFIFLSLAVKGCLLLALLVFKLLFDSLGLALLILRHIFFRDRRLFHWNFFVLF